MQKEELFILLKPSKIHGVGVFTERSINKNELVDIWEIGDWEYLKKSTGRLKKMCDHFSDGTYRPKSFVRLSLCWYLNHSKAPNLRTNQDGTMWAIRKIKTGEELTLNYDELKTVYSKTARLNKTSDSSPNTPKGESEK